MGVCASNTVESKEKSKEKHLNKKIERRLENDNEKDRDRIRILFLGTGESGKSTILKQMQILAHEDFLKYERETFRSIIRRNMVLAIQHLVEVAAENIEEKHIEAAELIEKTEYQLEESWSEELKNAIEELWAESKVIRGLWLQRERYHVPATIGYFFDAIERISLPNYLPNIQDILRVRNRTTGIHEKTLVVKNIKITFTDVGGQRNERRKWIHCFNKVTAVMFVAAISEYNQQLYEDEKQNRLTEAIEEFRKIVNNEVFANAGMILFLNKIDLLREKLEQVPFTGRFGYEGPNTLEPVQLYIRSLFERHVPGERSVHTHFTCGLDTDLIHRVSIPFFGHLC
ncbi:hypothetical protein AAMO2058_000147400 [Amorphochlora amoebiformis]